MKPGDRVTVNLPMSVFHGWRGTVQYLVRDDGVRLKMDSSLPERVGGLMFFGLEVLEKEEKI
jgi:hypothetical protein